MARLKKSSFNFIFREGDGYIYFNKITNLVRVYDRSQHEVFAANEFAKPEHEELARDFSEMGYLVPAERNEMRLVKAYYNRFVKPFQLTIELSRVCNFKCPYCYQNGTFDSKKVIAREVLDACVRYATYVLENKDVRDFELNFIGGEPLLHQDKLLYVYSRLLRLLDEKKTIRWRMVIDTNGSLLREDFLSRCRNTVLSVTLSPRAHHDRTRSYLNGRSSFDTIVKNILDNRRHFERDGNVLLIRYNLDHRNKDLMLEFLRFIAEWQMDGLSFMVVNVVNYDFNKDYYNELTEEEFFEQCGIALDEMVNLNVRVRLLPYGLVSPCYVFTPYTCKVFYDGRLNACDIADQPAEGSIFDLPNEDFFQRRETLNALTHKVCMGDYKICNYQVFALRQYLLSYLKAVREGKEHLFKEFVDYTTMMRENFSALIAEEHGSPARTGRSSYSPMTILTS